MSVPPPESLFPPRLAEVLADLSLVAFRREMTPRGDIHYTWFSNNLRDVFGYAPEEMTVGPRGALNAVHWADRSAHVDAIHRSATSGERCLETFRAVTAAGETRWFRGSSVPFAQPDGHVIWDGAWTDISPWMRAEHQFQTVMDHAEDCILTLDAKNGIDWVNAATERLFGYDQDEMLGRCLSEMLEAPCWPEPSPKPTECGADMLQCYPRGTRELMARTRDGQTFPFEMTVSEVRSDGRLSLIVIGRDITRRRETEQMLEETTRRLGSIAQNLPGVVFQRQMDAEGTLTYPYVSEAIAEITGHPAGDIVTDPGPLFDCMEDGDRRRLLASILDSAKTLEPVREDVRVDDGQGRRRWLRGQSRPRRRGTAIVWDGLILDVTEEVVERQKAEAAMRESEERFRQAFAAASLGIVVTGLDGSIHQFNPAFQVMSGRTGEDLRGLDFHLFVDKAVLPEAALRPGPNEAFCLNHDPVLPDGHERHWRITGSQFSAGSTATAPSLLYLIEDVTEITKAAEERRQLELALQEGQKLEALGRLAGGVAHELNNMLGPILIAAEMMARTLEMDDKNRERSARIIEAAKHGGSIVRNVLAYCRKEQKTLGPLDLVPVFTRAVDLARSALPPSVKVVVHAAMPSAMVVGDAGQITQVLINLANNAGHAMDGHGTLTLTLDAVEPNSLLPSRRRPRAQESVPNPFSGLDHMQRHVELRISDTGCGMSASTAAKIFDPFFTTKPVGQGTGLGLSVVQGIIKAMGGAIAVESVSGEGTTFRIVLPLVE